MVSGQLLVLFALIILTVRGEPFPCGYNYFSSTEGWLKIHPSGMLWSQASKVCSLEGAELASSRNDALKNAMLSLMLANSDTPIPLIHTNTFRRASINDVDLHEREAMGLSTSGRMQLLSQYQALPFICYRKDAQVVMLTNCGTIDKEYILDNRTRHCYKFHRSRSTWFEASMICMVEGGTLAVINNEDEAQSIRDIFARNPSDDIPGDQWKDSAFVGYWNMADDKWTTVHGQPFESAGYDGWYPGEPNNARGDEYCGSVGRNGQLFDDPCTRALPFICERRTSSNCATPKKIVEASTTTTMSPFEKAVALQREYYERMMNYTETQRKRMFL